MNRIILIALALMLATFPALARPNSHPPEPETSEWLHWYEMYRGQSVINVEDQLNKATDALRAKGWCWGPYDLPTVYWHMYKCKDEPEYQSLLGDAPNAMEIIGGSKRVDALPFSPSAEAIESELDAWNLPEFKTFAYWDGECRGGSAKTDEQGDKACELRDKAEEYLVLKGWCYGPPEAVGPDRHWYICKQHTDELPFSPSAEAIESELGEDQL
jgi:hypothetical protein